MESILPGIAKRLHLHHLSEGVLYHLKTLFLFTRSDFKSVVFPQTLFAIACALSTAPLIQDGPLKINEVIRRVPYVLAWTWVNLLVECIANQESKESIAEDKINKPWRPLPSGRVTPAEAQKWLWAALLVALGSSIMLGAFKPCLALMVHIWIYNDFKWEGSISNSNAILFRNAVNAGGLMCFSWGALSVIAGPQDLMPRAYVWILVTGAIVMTTIHAQDMPDVEGDSERGRVTVPLWYGERCARLTLATMVIFWSILCPFLWAGARLALLPVVVGTALSVLTLLQLGQQADKLVWKLWGVWMACLFLLPLSLQGTG